MRPIDGDALYEKFVADAKEMEEPVAQWFAIGAANDVKNAPTIDVIPIDYIKEVYRKYADEVTDAMYSHDATENVAIAIIRAATIYDLLHNYNKQ